MMSHEPETQATLTDENGAHPDAKADGSTYRLLPEMFRTGFMLRAIEEMSVEEGFRGAGSP